MRYQEEKSWWRETTIIGGVPEAKRKSFLRKKLALLLVGLLSYNTIGSVIANAAVGNTGVGKTLLAKEYAKLCYGKDNFIRIDMSEYREPHTISKLIGSPAALAIDKAPIFLK